MPWRHEARVVVLLCALAALRVFLFSAAFPFFNNVDEPAHVDLVHKYARGHVPAGDERLDSDTVRDVLLYGSQEYLVSAGSSPTVPSRRRCGVSPSIGSGIPSNPA